MKMKTCKYCNKRFPEKEFGIALTTPKKVYRRHKCKSCYRATKKKLQEKYRRLITDYKKEQKCSKCGITDYRVLEFHHADNTNKKFSIGAFLTNGYGFEQIKKEILKCVVICANCHRILHYNKNKKRIG